MSAASSPTAPSPQPEIARASRVCLNCKRKKKRCDKALPSCSRCVDSNQTCQHEDDLLSGDVTPTYSLFPGEQSPICSVGQIPRQSPQSWGGIRPSFVTSIRSTGKNIGALALQSVFDILESRQRVEYAVSAYFSGINTWLCAIERASFETELHDMLQNPQNPSAETSVLVLCMALLVQPSTDDYTYNSVKALLSLAQSSLPMSIPLMQAEILVALYEYQDGRQQQAYLSIGRCVHMSRMFGWHSMSYWSEERQASSPTILKFHSILWWAIVNLDLGLDVAFHETKYPRHTSNHGVDFDIPRPEAFDEYLPAPPVGNFLDVNSHLLEGMVFPEATSALYLNTTLQQLSNPLLTYSPQDREGFSETIWDHTGQLVRGPWSTGDRSAAIGTNSITVLKLNQPGLRNMVGVGSLPGLVQGSTFPAPVKRIRDTIDLIYAEAASPTRFQEKLALGRIAPCWAFAMYYASLLLISHGDNVLQDDAWLQKVMSMRSSLEAAARRWRITERYTLSIDQALHRRRISGYVA